MTWKEHGAGGGEWGMPWGCHSSLALSSHTALPTDCSCLPRVPPASAKRLVWGWGVVLGLLLKLLGESQAGAAGASGSHVEQQSLRGGQILTRPLSTYIQLSLMASQFHVPVNSLGGDVKPVCATTKKVPICLTYTGQGYKLPSSGT